MRTNYEIYRLKRRWVQLRSWRLFIFSLEADPRRRGSAQSAWSWVRQSILPCLTYTTLLAKGENYYSFIIMNINALKHVTFSAQEILKHTQARSWKVCISESSIPAPVSKCDCNSIGLKLKAYSVDTAVNCNCDAQARHSTWYQLRYRCMYAHVNLLGTSCDAQLCHSTWCQLRCICMPFHLVPAVIHMPYAHVIPLGTIFALLDTLSLVQWWNWSLQEGVGETVQESIPSIPENSISWLL